MLNSTTNIDGKVALITGGTRRIGGQIAHTLHQSGMVVCVHYRSQPSQAKAFAEKLGQHRKNSVTLIQADLLDTDQLVPIIETVIKDYGRLDLLVNNASSFYPTPVGKITVADWDKLMGSNLKAPLFLCQAAAPYLAKTQGCILNMIDIHAKRPMKNHAVYNMAKAGLLAMTRSLARELAPAVRVNGIAPGAILWSEQEHRATKEAILRRTALKRAGEPQDIANAALFLFRDAPYITGHMLPVDGGRLLNI